MKKFSISAPLYIYISVSLFQAFFVFVFQLEVTLEMMSKFALETKAALEQIISASNTVDRLDRSDKYKKSHMGDVLGKALRNVNTSYVLYSL